MTSWTRQEGFPLVTASRLYNSSELHLTQLRYVTNVQGPINNSSYIFWIPYVIATPSDPNPNTYKWLNQQSQIIDNNELNGLQASDWLLISTEQSGYYRVLYDIPNYKLLSSALLKRRENKINNLTITQLINDAHSFLFSGLLNAEIFFNLIEFLSNCTDYAPWAAAFKAIEEIDNFYSGDENYPLFMV